MPSKKILAITGIRSEYDILYPVIKCLKEESEFECRVVVAGAHLSPWHGETVKKIEEDGFEIVEKIDTLFMTNRNTQRVKGVGILTYALSQTVEREKPTFLLVVGDREESIATALVGNYMDVLVAHIGGGDPVYGNADDPIRFAVSKLAHIHLVTAKEYAENLRKIGEEEFRIFWVGNPIYTAIGWVKEKSLAEISSFLKFEIEEGKIGVLLKHPLSSEKEEAYFQMKITLKAVKRFAEKHKFKFIGIYPNTDPGAYDILRAIEEEVDNKLIKFFKALPREIFVNLMRKAMVLVGNSSMGILEAPFYRVPVVNVGRRQIGRLNTGNVEFVDYKEEKIIKAIEKAVFDNTYREYIKNLDNSYGDAKNTYRTVDVLKNIDISDKKWYVKKKLC